MTKKIDRHDLKKDEFATDVAKIYGYASDNPTRILVWVIIVLVVAGGAIGYYSYNKKNKKDAKYKLSLVYTMMDAGQYNEALDTVKVIMGKYNGTQAGDIAKYLFAHLNYAFGYLDSSITAYEDYLAIEHPDSDLAPAALMGIATCYEDKSRYTDAIKYYTQILDKYPNFFHNDEVMLSIGRCYDVSGDFANAIKYYQDFLAKFPESPFQQRAIVLLSRAKARAYASISPQIPTNIKPQKSEG